MTKNLFYIENHTLYLQNIMQQRFYRKMIGEGANWLSPPKMSVVPLKWSPLLKSVNLESTV